MGRQKALVERTYRVKNPAMNFFCPLCRTERAVQITPRLTAHHFVQIIIAGMFFSLVLFKLLGAMSLGSFFVVWGGYEFFLRAHFRKEVPCPHCGFDASWYKRDVKVARRLVAEFWERQPKKSDK